jgi:hypothetical protein
MGRRERLHKADHRHSAKLLSGLADMVSLARLGKIILT